MSRWHYVLQQRHWVEDGAAGKVMEGRAAWPSSRVRMVLPALFLGQPAAGLPCTVCLPSCRKQGTTCFCVLSLTHSFVTGLHLLFLIWSPIHSFICSYSALSLKTIVCMHVCTHMSVCICVCVPVCVCSSTFIRASENELRFPSLFSKCLHKLSHLTSPHFILRQGLMWLRLDSNSLCN